MRKPDGVGCLFVLVASLAIPTLAFGASGHGEAASGSSAPCLTVIDPYLKPLGDLAWEYSETFRRQCRTLAAARVTVIVRSASSRETLRADTRITVTDGITLARVRINPGSHALEHLAHELEHVLERVEGVNLLMESRRGGSQVVLVGGAYETRRAIDAGLRVARDVHEATRAMAKAR